MLIITTTDRSFDALGGKFSEVARAKVSAHSFPPEGSVAKTVRVLATDDDGKAIVRHDPAEFKGSSVYHVKVKDFGDVPGAVRDLVDYIARARSSGSAWVGKQLIVPRR